MENPMSQSLSIIALLSLTYTDTISRSEKSILTITSSVLPGLSTSADVSQALELSPHDKNALLARSKCYLLLGEPQKALEDAEAALNEKVKDPNNARAMFYKAEALYHLGDFELSLVYYYRGMRIRPEFDQFRLGVQKAKEAIQNILGNSSVPMVFNSRRQDAEGPEESGRTLEGVEEHLKQPGPSQETVSSVGEKKREAGPVKRRNNSPNVLGQLNVDKKYLQDLLKSPDIKAAHQVSAQHITKYAEEGVSFLKNRQEFWRQQRSAFHAGF